MAPPRVGAQPTRGAQDVPPLPAPITLGWDAGDVFSPGAVAHGQLTRLTETLCARDVPLPSAGWCSVCPALCATCAT